MPAIKTDCKEVQQVNSLFQNNVIDGNSPLDKLKYIGQYIKTRASNLPPHILNMNAQTKQAPTSIQTLSHLVTKASQAKTQQNVDKLLEYCTYNKRRNTCVKQGSGKPDYQVPDINVCGYNTLLAVLYIELDELENMIHMCVLDQNISTLQVIRMLFVYTANADKDNEYFSINFGRKRIPLQGFFKLENRIKFSYKDFE